MKKLILAYSGGLDTSIILTWLVDQGYEVICFIADVGQQEDFEAIREKALHLGATKVYVEDLKEEFLTKFIFKALQAHARYEGKYLLGTALARPLIGKAISLVAHREKTLFIGHGATGKGNDQVRFELAIYGQLPNAKIIAPWRLPEFYQRFQGRRDLIQYAHEKKIPISCSLKRSFSMDENLMHISYEGGILEDLSAAPPEDMFKLTISPQQAPDREVELAITFEQGIPITLKLAGQTTTGAINIFQTLQKISGENGIGRTDIVESRIVGMKSRGVYESPAATVLWLAHAELENLVLQKEVLKLKEELQPKIADLIYQGLWFSPEMNTLMTAINESQQCVNGTIHLSLYKGNISVIARFSKESLYSRSLVSMDELGNYDQADASGFIKIFALSRISKCGQRNGNALPR